MQRIKLHRLICLLTTTAMVLLGGRAVLAENIDPEDDGSQYAYGENVGWLNLEPGGDGGQGVEVGDFALTGYMWAENTGWVSLSCENTASCGTVYYGVANDGYGNLSGYAWAENLGWLSFSCRENAMIHYVGYTVANGRASTRGTSTGRSTLG